jgi:hypothetical protein
MLIYFCIKMLFGLSSLNMAFNGKSYVQVPIMHCKCDWVRILLKIPAPRFYFRCERTMVAMQNHFKNGDGDWDDWRQGECVLPALVSNRLL